jgi:hypothetical protein
MNKMRQILFIAVLYVGLFAASAIVGDAQTRQTYFGTGDAGGDACEAALRTGSYNHYRPTYFGLHKKLAAGEDVRGLESDVCVEMMTVKGYQWVIQKEGEKMVFKGLNIVRREDCGNPIRNIRHPKTAVEIPVAPKCPEGTYPSETPGLCVVEKEKEKIVTNTVTVTKDVFPCPVFTGARYGSKGIGARLPSALELLVAAGKGAAIGYIGSNERRGEAALLSAGLSAVDTTVTNLFIPDYNVLYLEGPFAIMVKKGKSTTSADGRFILSWEKGGTILGSLSTGEVCFAGAVQKSFNTGSIAIVNRRGNVKQTIPVKTLPTTGSKVPIRPGTGINTPTGRLPGGSVPNPTTGIPTRPRLGNSLVDDAYGNSQNAQTSNSVSTSVVAPCKGQLITLRGIKRCVND